MKNLLTIFTLLFTVMIPSTSFAEWTKIAEDDVGDNWYVDFERIRKHDGYVFYWELSDYLKPTGIRDLSDKMYWQGNCKLFQFKSLSLSSHKKSMGGGIGVTHNRKNTD